MPADRPMQRAATWGIAILAAAAIGAGLALSGGPERGRKERRDDARLQDLGQMSQTINCLAGDSARLPAEIATTGGCPGPIRTVDPFTDQPYRVEPVGEGKYRLCAGFELPAEAAQSWPARDGDCLVYDLPRPNPVQVVPPPPAG